MRKYINFSIILLSFAIQNSYAADLYDIYKRALIHNNEFRLLKMIKKYLKSNTIKLFHQFFQI